MQKTKVFQPLKSIDSNYSFDSASNDLDRFEIMFLNSEIAKSYRQGEMEKKCNIQFRIAPYIKECLLYKTPDVPFYVNLIQQ